MTEGSWGRLSGAPSMGPLPMSSAAAEWGKPATVILSPGPTPSGLVWLKKLLADMSTACRRAEHLKAGASVKGGSLPNAYGAQPLPGLGRGAVMVQKGSMWVAA